MKLRVGYLQFEPLLLEPEENIERIAKIIEKAPDFDLLVLPELSNSGYVFANKKEVEKVAEEIPNGNFTSQILELAKERNAHIVAGVCEKKGNIYFNSSVLVAPTGYVATYRKIHLFDREKLFFSPGNEPFNVYTITDNVKIGLLICFDWIFPEASRVMALKGAEILCHSANLVLPYSQKAMLTRSVENGVYTITANRIGTEENQGTKLKFTGQSQVTSPQMEILAQAKENNTEIKIVDIDPEKARNKWLNSRNHILNDRRPEFYSNLTQKK